MTDKKGHWIAMVRITDAANRPRTIEANAEAFRKYGARFLVRGRRHEDPEGFSGDRHVVVEFESLAQAPVCYHSPEYQEALKLRRAFSDAHLAIVEGA